MYVVRAFDGPHLEFKMAGVAGLVRGRVVVIIMCQCFILFHFFFSLAGSSLVLVG